MNAQEKKEEFNYRFQERLGMMSEAGEPTTEQVRQAEAEAKSAVAEIVYREALCA
jgi:hypothetical protein